MGIVEGFPWRLSRAREIAERFPLSHSRQLPRKPVARCYDPNLNNILSNFLHEEECLKALLALKAQTLRLK